MAAKGNNTSYFTQSKQSFKVMRDQRISIVLSWLLSQVMIFAGLLSSSAMRGELSQYSGGDLFSFIVLAIFLAASCSWPWVRAFFISSQPNSRRRTYAFSIVAVLVAAQTGSAMSHAPSEGVGANLILGIVLIWSGWGISRFLSK